MKKTFIFLLSLLFACSLNLGAIELRIEEEKELTETGQFDDDYFFAGKRIDFKGAARDLFLFAEEVSFSGNSSLALFAFAEFVNTAGNVGNGIKSAARVVNISSTVRGTSFLAGEQVNWEPGSKTVGDTFIGARKARIQGKITGDLYIGAADVSIENVIHGNVKMHAGQLTIPEGGKIVGDLYYSTDNRLSPEEASRVTGEIRFEQTEGGPFHDSINSDDFSGSFWFSIFFKISYAVFGFLILLFPVAKVLEKKLNRSEILSYGLWGLIPIFMYPTILVISAVLVITLPLAIAMLLGFLPLIFISKAIGITVIGGFLANALNLRSTSRFLYFLIGIVLYSLLSFIPIFGGLLLVFVSSIGCGILLSLLIGRKTAGRGVRRY